MKTRVNLKYFVNDSQLRMMSGFCNKINAKPYSIVESCSILSQNIVKSKSKFKINHTSMNDYNYGKLPLSLKVISLQICKQKFCNNSNCDKLY